MKATGRSTGRGVCEREREREIGWIAFEESNWVRALVEPLPYFALSYHHIINNKFHISWFYNVSPTSSNACSNDENGHLQWRSFSIDFFQRFFCTDNLPPGTYYLLAPIMRSGQLSICPLGKFKCSKYSHSRPLFSVFKNLHWICNHQSTNEICIHLFSRWQRRWRRQH